MNLSKGGVMTLENMTLCEYRNYLNHLKKLTVKACKRYRIFQLCSNPVEREDIVHDVCVNAFLKAIKTYSKKKGSFNTYFYYKASSLARVAAIKLKPRYKLINTFPLETERIC